MMILIVWIMILPMKNFNYIHCMHCSSTLIVQTSCESMKKINVEKWQFNILFLLSILTTLLSMSYSIPIIRTLSTL